MTNINGKDYPHIHKYRDRTDAWRYYVRIKGRKKVPLRSPPGSAEFDAQYNAAVANPDYMIRRQKDGTLAALVIDFYRSTEFANLSGASPRLYRQVLERIVAKYGARLVRDLPRDKARKIIEEIGATRPAMANLARAVLRRLFEFAIATGQRPDEINPFARIPRYKLGSHHTWTDDEIAQFEKRWAVGTRERLHFAVLLYTMQRVSDAVTFRRADAKRGVLSVVQQKTGAEVFIPIHPELARIIEATEAKGLTVIGDRNGRPMSAAALSGQMADAIAGAKLPDRCVAHGLRKAGLRRMAEGGATVHQIKSISGHASLAEVQRYTEAADRARLAKDAIAFLPNGKRTDGG